MEFHSPKTQRIYSDRQVDTAWFVWINTHLAPQGKRVIDFGCGGGIYSEGFVIAGAKSVIGVDLSIQYVTAAKEEFVGYENLRFQVGNAMSTGLESACADIVFERALIHHLTPDEQLKNAQECYRLLIVGGCLSVQDRTLEDVVDTNPDAWIRTTLIEAFPRLVDFERQRRPSRRDYEDILINSGFNNIKTLTYAEIRKRYDAFDVLEQEIMSRKGKSTLFELNDTELRQYCDLLSEKSQTRELIECDRWTVWLSEKV